jgi:hypothetical protein
MGDDDAWGMVVLWIYGSFGVRYNNLFRLFK